ncbi:MAG: MATE family efflux transporter [Firmicutes bacterium]|nr:MATE family efflux transporter [Bacillota bacterium]
MHAKSEHDRMMHAPTSRLLLSLALPSMASMLITSAASLVDSLTVSSLGTEATGAVGICFSLMACIQAVGFTLGMGGGSLISLQLGEKDVAAASRIASVSFFTAILSGLIIACGIFWRTPILRLLGASDAILPLASEYSVYIFLAAPFLTGLLCLSHLLRAEGHTGRALTGIAAAGLLNMALDPLLVGPLGVQGISLATLISHALGFGVLLFTFCTGKTSLRLQWPRLCRRPRPLLPSILASGSPSLLRQGLAAVSAILLSRAARQQSDAAVAAMSVAGKIFMIPFTLMLGYAQGLQPLIGFNFANQNAKRIRQASHFTLWTGTVALAAAGGLLYWRAEQLVNLFMETGDGPAIASAALRAGALTLPLIPACTLANLGYQAVKRPAIASFLAAARQGLFFIPLIVWLPGLWGLSGVQFAQALADGATFLLSAPFLVYFFRKAVDNKSGKV